MKASRRPPGSAPVFCLLVALGISNVFITRPSSAQSLEESKQMYFDGRYQEAIEALIAVVNQLRVPAQLADARLFLGMSHHAEGDEASARSFFESAVRNNVNLVPIEELFPADAVRLFRNVRADLVGSINVRTNPSGARAFVAGRPVGSTPYEGNVIIGEQSVRVELDDYIGESRNVQIEAGEVTTVLIPLRMTQAAIARIREEARARPGAQSEGGFSRSHYIVLGSAGAGIGVGLVLNSSAGNSEAGTTATRNFSNTIGAFQTAGPFTAPVGASGTLSITLTWDDPGAALALSVLKQGETTTMAGEAFDGTSPTSLTISVVDSFYQILIRNVTPVITIFNLALSFPG